MTVYSKLLAAGRLPGPGEHQAYVTPSGHTSILKSVTFYLATQPNKICYVNTAVAPETVAPVIWATVEYQKPITFDVWHVLPAGYGLSVGTFDLGVVFFWCSGTELIGSPPTPTVPTLPALRDASPPAPSVGAPTPEALPSATVLHVGHRQGDERFSPGA